MLPQSVLLDLIRALHLMRCKAKTSCQQCGFRHLLVKQLSRNGHVVADLVVSSSPQVLSMIINAAYKPGRVLRELQLVEDPHWNFQEETLKAK